MKKKQEICVLCDSREQLPYSYPLMERVSLKTGDYSVKGFEKDGITIERKTVNDIYGSLGKGRRRFENECQRMKDYKYKAIVIEASLQELLKQPLNSQMNPKVVINSLISLSVKYDIKVWFCSNRRLARVTVLRILEKFVKHNPKEGDK